MMELGPDLIGSGDLFNALLRVFTNRWPTPVTAILLFGSIGGAFYLVQKRVIVPLVMMIIVGGVTIAEAPTVFLQGISAAVILVLTGIAFYLINRYRVK